MNFDIENAAQNYKRPQNIQPVYANMNQSIQRQGSWEQPYFHKNTFDVPPPPNYGNNNPRH